MITIWNKFYVYEPIRDKNRLDLVFSSHSKFISQFFIILGISDQDAVLFNCNLKEISSNSLNHNETTLYHKGDYDGIKTGF